MASSPLFGPIKALPLDQMLADVPRKVHELPLKSFNKGIFGTELINLDVLPPTDSKVVAPSIKSPKEPQGNITEGTYGGTQLALTEIYDRVESG